MKHPVEIIAEWSLASGLKAYAIIRDGRLAGKVVLRTSKSGATVKAIATTIDAQHKRVMYRGQASGYGYDKHSCAMAGWTIEGVIVHEYGERWTRQLEDQGFIVVEVL